MEREAIKCQQSLRIFDAMDALYRVGQYFPKSRNGISVGNSNLLSAYMGHNAFLLRYQTQYQPNLIHRLVKQTGISIKQKAISFKQKILDDENSFQYKCNNVSNLIRPIRDYKYADVGEADVFAHECGIVLKTCSNVCAEAKQIEEDRRILGMDQIDYGHVYAVLKEIKEYSRLWFIIAEIQRFYEKVLETDVSQYPADYALDKIKGQWLPELHKLSKIFSGLAIQHEILSLTKSKLLLLKKHDKVFRLLVDDCLRKRHWIALKGVFDNDRKVSDHDNQQNNDETTNYKSHTG